MEIKYSWISGLVDLWIREFMDLWIIKKQGNERSQFIPKPWVVPACHDKSEIAKRIGKKVEQNFG
ncbi:MAG: hypothetical protein L0Y76_00200 [Ignavibacteria bacterium]|nr:hypothetical protein [Ignavibacteria bacterium]